MNILVIDVGTTSMRGILFMGNGEKIDCEARRSTLIINSDRIEQSAESFLNDLIGICSAISRRHRVDAVSLSAFRSAVTAVDAYGRALRNFIMWQDTRNREICESYADLSDIIFERSGAKLNTVFTATRIRWMLENELDICEKASKFVVVPDYLIHAMTGEFLTDRTYGSRTHLMNIKTLQWDEQLCTMFGIRREMLCPLTDQGSIVGRVTNEFAEQSGLEQGIPVISAGGDQQCGALGLGVFDGSAIEVNCGTGAFIVAISDVPVTENTAAICNVSAIRGKYILESNVLACSSALDWLLREFTVDGSQPDFAAADALAETSPAGANGVFCIPHFQGCGTRDWRPDSRAAFWGMSLGTTRADLIRALYEGIACEIAKSMDALPKTVRSAGTVYISGGLTKSCVFDRILADMLGCSLLRYDDEQATAIGAFVSAATQLGLYPGHSEALRAARGVSGTEMVKPNVQTRELYGEYRVETERMYRTGMRR